MLKNRSFQSVLCGVALSCSIAEGSGISWGSELFASAEDSENVALDSAWSFYLGYFEAGFTPTEENTEEWAVHWTTLDVSDYVPIVGFSGVWDHDGVSTGKRGYIWGANRSLPSNEWVLLTASAWTVPPFEELGADVDWIASDADSILVGEVEADGGITTEVVSGEPPLLSGGEWQQLYFPEGDLTNLAVVGWDADPDGDGLTNLVEFAFGAQPLVRDQIESESGIEGDFFQFETTRARNVEVRYFGEVSSDLQSWDEGQELITLRDESPSSLTYQALRTVSEEPKLFGRVRVELAP